MATQTNRIMDLLLAGHGIGTIAELLDVPSDTVVAAAANLTSTPSVAGSQITPSVSAPAPVSGTALQDQTNLPSEVYVPITGHTGGTVTVAIGPTNAVANTIINAEDASLTHTVRFRLPAGWFFKVTCAGSAAIAAAAVQITG